MPRTPLDNFFYPSSVAVIGASANPQKIGHMILKSIIESNFKGKVYPINPKGGEILGLKVYRSVLEIPDDVDLAVIAVPPKIVPQVIEDCGKKRIRAAVIISGGFKETGAEGAELERRTVETAKKYGIRIIGPNCIGVFCPENGINTFFQVKERMLRPGPGGIAFLTQSGTYGCTLLEWIAESPGIGVSKFVSYGNRCDVDETELVRYLSKDPKTKVIALYVEGLSDGRKFMEAAIEAAKYKPIIMLKAGRTKKGSQAAVSHTGHLSGEYKIYQAMFKQVGIIEARNMEELYDFVKVFSMQPLPSGSRVAMVSNGAGPCVFATDMIDSSNMLKIAKLSDETVKEIREKIPMAVISTLVDLTGSATTRDYEAALEAIAKDNNVDIIMPFFVFQDTPLGEDIVDVLDRLKRYGKPIIVCAGGGPFTRRMNQEIEKRGIPTYQTPERAVRAAEALVTYVMYREKIKLQ